MASPTAETAAVLADTAAPASETSTSASCDEEPSVCWICLEGASEERPLMHPCRCPRHCHAACIARWQLQSAGTRKERHCEFCSGKLPDWRKALTPACGTCSPAIMNVNFDGHAYSFEVSPGRLGYQQFTAAIRVAFSLPGEAELNITFTCDDPTSGALLTLSGAGAYDAAVHCAAISAARRLTQQPHQAAAGSPQTAGSAAAGNAGSATGGIPHRYAPPVSFAGRGGAGHRGAPGASGATGGRTVTGALSPPVVVPWRPAAPRGAAAAAAAGGGGVTHAVAEVPSRAGVAGGLSGLGKKLRDLFVEILRT